MIAGRAFWFYPQKILWPEPLIFIYPKWSVDPRLWSAYLFPVCALFTLSMLFVRRHQLGRGPLVAVLFYIITLLPAIGLITHFMMRYAYVADHLQY